MTSISNPIVYFGTDNLSVKPLKRLLEAGFNIRTIVTKPDALTGRGRKITPPEVKIIGLTHGIEVLQPQSLIEIGDFIKKLDNPVGVLVSFGRLIPKEIIDLFPAGIINIHPSLLPRYRGPSPIETAMLNGDSKTGVTLMQLAPEMDAGPIYAQKNLPLSGSEAKNQLYDTLAELGANLLITYLPGITDGSLKPTPQDESKATYCQKLTKLMSRLDVVNKTTTELLRQIRAFADFPKSKLELFGDNCTVNSAHAASSANTKLDQKCKDGLYLIIDKLVPPNSHEMTAQDFLNGHPHIN